MPGPLHKPAHKTLGDMIRDTQAAEAAADGCQPFDGPGQVYALRGRVASLEARLAAQEELVHRLIDSVNAERTFERTPGGPRPRA
jgi:hypothetical protein